MKAILLASAALFALTGAASATEPRNEKVFNTVTGNTYQVSHGIHFGIAGAHNGIAQGFSVGTQHTNAYSSASGCGCSGVKGDANVNGTLEQGAIATVGQVGAQPVAGTGVAGAAAGGVQGSTAGYSTTSYSETRRNY